VGDRPERVADRQHVRFGGLSGGEGGRDRSPECAEAVYPGRGLVRRSAPELVRVGDEHHLVVHRVLQAKIDIGQRDGLQRPERVRFAGSRGESCREEPETFLAHRVDERVLVVEMAIDRGRGISRALGDPS
jgi:hypothetical protein